MESLIVVMVIAVVAALIFPIFGSMRVAGNSVKCINHLRQLHEVSIRWSQEHSNDLPGWQTWYSDIAPYLSDVRLQQKNGIQTVATCPSMYREKRSVSPIGHTYALNHRTGTKSDWVKKLNWFTKPSEVAHFVDGFAAGKSADQLWWIYSSAFYPDSGTGNVSNLEFPHGGKVNIVYMDGHVESFDRSFLPSITDKTKPGYASFWGTQQ